LKKPSDSFGGGFDVANKADSIAQLEQLSAAPGFWDDAANAQESMRELTRLRDDVGEWQNVSNRLADAQELAEWDDAEFEDELRADVEALAIAVADLEFHALFAGKYDNENAILAIHAGAGGTEAQDWAQMLQRMFIRWAGTHEFKVSLMDESQGDSAGIKSCLIELEGDYVYGRLKSERGVHRLVRISPYDSSSRRHTSFAKVEVWPNIQQDIDIEIDPKDLRIDRFRASGAGGQHVQKNETAIRITHYPSG